MPVHGRPMNAHQNQREHRWRVYASPDGVVRLMGAHGRIPDSMIDPWVPTRHAWKNRWCPWIPVVSPLASMGLPWTPIGDPRATTRLRWVPKKHPWMPIECKCVTCAHLTVNQAETLGQRREPMDVHRWPMRHPSPPMGLWDTLWRPRLPIGCTRTPRRHYGRPRQTCGHIRRPTHADGFAHGNLMRAHGHPVVNAWKPHGRPTGVP